MKPLILHVHTFLYGSIHVRRESEIEEDSVKIERNEVERWGTRERARERVSVCVCVRERGRERGGGEH